MKRWPWISLLLIVALLAVSVMGCNPKPKNDLERVLSAKKIVVGTSADYPPFEFVDENGKYDGFDIKVMEEIARRLGVTVEWQDIAFDGLIGALQAGKIDAIIAAMSATEEREKQVDFTQNYFIGADAILVAEGANITINKPEDMGSYKIGVQRGTLHETWVKDNLAGAQVSSYERAEQAIMDLKSGRVDVVAMDYYASLAFINQGGIKLALKTDLAGEHMAIAVREGSVELRDKLNEIIDKMQAEGLIDQLAMQYLGGQ